jgi:hypothetical protein
VDSMAETASNRPASVEKIHDRSAGGFERLPIEVQPLSPPTDGGPSAAFMEAATAVVASAPETPAGES